MHPRTPSTTSFPASDTAPWPGVAFIGAGRVARTLAPLLHTLGVPLRAIASRSPGPAAVLSQSLGVPACGAAQAAVDRAELVFLTVPDDAIAAVAAGLRWRAGMAVVHCSGATDVAVLQPALEAGADIGGFHPLQLFADPASAAAGLAGCGVALEAGERLMPVLQRLALALGLHPFRLPPGSRARYHAGAGYAASFLLPLLQEALTLWRSIGLDEDTALAALLPLARGTLAAVQDHGVAGALSGPLARGDTGVLSRQLTALDALGPAHAALFRSLAAAQLPLAEAAGRLDSAQLGRLAALLSPARPAP